MVPKLAVRILSVRYELSVAAANTEFCDTSIILALQFNKYNPGVVFVRVRFDRVHEDQNPGALPQTLLYTARGAREAVRQSLTTSRAEAGRFA